MTPDKRIGKYTLLRPLGAGGMAQIWLARVDGPMGFRKLVALKSLHPNLVDNETFVTLFFDEARLAARLNHPNIVQIYDLGEEEGVYYLAMEYVHGHSLIDLFRAAASRREPLPLDLTLGVLVSACEGLGFAHAQRGDDGQPLGVVHRDVSPQNLLVSRDGCVKLVDFGIARAANQIHQTVIGQVMGKVVYMSPEQALAQPVDRRTDIYALGVLAHEMLTGQRVFRRTDGRYDMEARAEPPAPSSIAPRVPPRLDAIALKALAFSADRRYQTCDEMRADLERAMGELGVLNSASRRAELLAAWFPDEAAAAPEEAPATVPMTPVARTPAPREPAATSQAVTVSLEPSGPTATATGMVGEAFETRVDAAAPNGASWRRRSWGIGLGLAGGALVAAAIALVPSHRAAPIDPASRPTAAPPAPVAAAEPLAPSAPAAAAPKETTAAAPAPAPTPVAAPAPRATPLARLELSTTPNGLWVYANGHALGRTPIRGAALKAGRWHLKLADPARGIETRLELKAEPGETVQKSVVVQGAKLRVRAIPWAEVVVDGKSEGSTPLPPLQLYAGSHTVELTYRPSGAAAVKRVEHLTLRGGEDHLLEVDLRTR